MTVWTTEEKNRLKQYRAMNISWERIGIIMGKSAGQIANMAKRLGISDKKEIKTQSSILPRPKLEDPNAVTLENIGKHQCKFPVADTSPFTLCGRPRFENTQYCDTHYKRCTQEGTRRWPV